MKQFTGLFILGYLRTFAKLQLLKNRQAIVIGITGSSGKTSTRLALVKILATHGRVKHSIHANSESGIPLNILGLSLRSFALLDWLRVILLAPVMVLVDWRHFDYYVVEMGIDSPYSPKNMGYLLSIVRPHVGIVLGAGLVHGAAFDSLVKDKNPARRNFKIRAAIAKEKMQLARGIDPAGVAIVNRDDPALVAELQGIKSRLLTYGRSARSSLRFTKVVSGKNGFRCDFTYQSQPFSLSLPDPLPPHYAGTIAAAVLAATAVGIPIGKSLAALAGLRTPAGRFRLFHGVYSSTIIDSSYNASPTSMHESLIHFAALGKDAHKIAVIGDMRELGLQTKSVHKALADDLLLYADEAVLFGPMTAEYTVPVLASRGFPVRHFARMDEVISYLQKNLSKNSWILVKGSQNTLFLERAVAALLADKNDVKFLCRRGAYWDRLRAKTP